MHITVNIITTVGFQLNNKRAWKTALRRGGVGGHKFEKEGSTAKVFRKTCENILCGILYNLATWKSQGFFYGLEKS